MIRYQKCQLYWLQLVMKIVIFTCYKFDELIELLIFIIMIMDKNYGISIKHGIFGKGPQILNNQKQENSGF